MPQVIQLKSKVNYSYATVKMTQSRIDKGLIAIPKSLAKWFPDNNTTIQIYLDDSPVLHDKNYSSYSSSTHECRIGGLAEWFEENKLKNGDEIVVQLIDKENFIYRLIPEHNFISKTQELQRSFDKSDSEVNALDKITNLAKWTDLDEKMVVINEYYRLINSLPFEKRRYIKKYSNRARERVPYNLKVLLGDIYQGHCQVCDFWFLKKDNTAYYEIHHISPLFGNHPKNLILVCPNCHSQFEYADVHHQFNNEDWLISVTFNKDTYSINQIILKTRLEDSYKKLFI